MTRPFALAALVVFGMHPSHCQDRTAAPTFEVASITPCKPGTPEPPGEHAGMVRFVYPGGRFNASATTLKFLIEWAWGIQPPQHSGGPSWLDTERYDIAAKAPGPATEAQIKLMVQTLLADRFQLKCHRETRNLSVYVLSLGKNPPKLSPSKSDATQFLHVDPRMGPEGKPASFHVEATRFSLTQFTDTFARQLGHVILDQTGLRGYFDFALDLTPDDSRPNPLDPSILLAAMREQLGLTLRAQTAPVEILAIDSAERVAAGN